jgi:hypothetical protein
LAGLANGGFIEVTRGVAMKGGVSNGLVNIGGVEVDIGDGEEEGAEKESVHVRGCGAEEAGGVGVLSDSLGGVEEEVLEYGGVLIFAADGEGGASGAFGRLFALVAEGHSVTGFIRVIADRSRRVFWGRM